MKRLFAALILAGTLAASTGGAVFADTTPPPNGQPSASCETSTTRPGAAMFASGSAFNPDGTAGAHYAGNDGTKSLANANSPAAVSQYDVACFQQTTHG
ncbi:MAG: adenylate cyclase [Chloroflexota bacterium]|nr:adenylate cyclase [Chloroflexota bacterium]